MHLSELMPAARQLSRQDKLRLIHMLLVEVAEEEGCELIPAKQEAREILLAKLAATDAVAWSPYDTQGAAQALSELLVVSRPKLL